MSDMIREFFLGRVVLHGPWTFFFRGLEIFLVLSILSGLYHQFF